MATITNKNTTRKRGCNPDQHGRYRPYIGEYRDTDGQVKPKRFNLGTDRVEALRRYHRLHDLYAEAGGPWRGRTLEYAHAIASGEKPQFAAHDTDKTYPYCFDFSKPAHYAQEVIAERTLLPSIANELQVDGPRFAASTAANRDYVTKRLAELEAKLKELNALAAGAVTMPDRIIAGTFHEALTDYYADIEKTSPKLECGSKKQWERKRLERVDNFKKTHADCPLYELTKGKLEEMIVHWRNRPVTKKGTRSSNSNAEHHLDELGRFIDWLDASEKYQWDKPKGTDQISRKIEKFDSEKKLSAVTKLVYSPEQLAQIYATATPRERLAICLGLNCAFGAAELGRLTISDFYLGQAHPYPKLLGIKTSASDNYLRYFRPKTTVFGEFFLWPETVKMVNWAIGRAKGLGSDLLFVRDSGKPLYDPAAKKPDAGFANLWSYAHKRSGLDVWLPFGSLRDTLPDYLRQQHEAEISSMCLTHGTPGVDQLIDCYSNKPWARFHEAVKAARDFYAPVFAIE